MHALMNQSKIVLFMKGNPKRPYCQFSRKMVNLLKENNIAEYSYFDILKDQSVREGRFLYIYFHYFEPILIIICAMQA